MRYAGLNKNDFVNGEGVSVSLFTQGCPHRCKGCFNPETWDFEGGREIDRDNLLNEIVTAMTANGIRRNFSVLGGEPLCYQNIDDTEYLIRGVRAACPWAKIYVWTGYDRKVFNGDALWDYVDVMITGPYIEELRDVTLPLRGSSNQEVVLQCDGRRP
jgi:anaerobic ribonucleoside-triphosphate reductase activating protein